LLPAVLAKYGHERMLFDTSLYDIPITGRTYDYSAAEQLLVFPQGL
jgi:hypothetical protein